jgi:transcriptional regulator with XRE-family HTH domain
MKTVRELRAERGWTQRQVATLLGVDQMTISGWERKRQRPFPIQLHKLCALFGVRPEDLDLAPERRPGRRRRGPDMAAGATSAPATDEGGV